MRRRSRLLRGARLRVGLRRCWHCGRRLRMLLRLSNRLLRLRLLKSCSRKRGTHGNDDIDGSQAIHFSSVLHRLNLVFESEFMVLDDPRETDEIALPFGERFLSANGGTNGQINQSIALRIFRIYVCRTCLTLGRSSCESLPLRRLVCLVREA